VLNSNNILIENNAQENKHLSLSSLIDVLDDNLVTESQTISSSDESSEPKQNNISSQKKYFSLDWNMIWMNAIEFENFDLAIYILNKKKIIPETFYDQTSTHFILEKIINCSNLSLDTLHTPNKLTIFFQSIIELYYTINSRDLDDKIFYELRWCALGRNEIIFQLLEEKINESISKYMDRDS
jgi:hypothetical protein